MIQYKFNEGELIDQLKEYIDATYSGHYSKNKFQSTEFKYVQRYGKKNGKNRADLLKVLHYTIIALSVHDQEYADEQLSKVVPMEPEGKVIKQQKDSRHNQW
jgi:hypothetical protein